PDRQVRRRRTARRGETILVPETCGGSPVGSGRKEWKSSMRQRPVCGSRTQRTRMVAPGKLNRFLEGSIDEETCGDSRFGRKRPPARGRRPRPRGGRGEEHELERVDH